MATVEQAQPSGAYFGRNDAVDPRGGQMPDKLVTWNQRRQQGSSDRLRYEPAWHLAQSYLQNRQWVAWDWQQRQIVELPDDGRERHTTNVMTSRVATVEGKLFQDELMPDATFRRTDVESVKFANQARHALEFAWTEELEVEERLDDMGTEMLTYGTAALGLRVEPRLDRVIGQLPIGPDGQVIADPREAANFMQAELARGAVPRMQPITETQLALDVYNPFMMIPPPGVKHEMHFPWFITETAMSLSTIKTRWPGMADEIVAERIRTNDLVGMMEIGDSLTGPRGAGQLQDHAKVYVGYEMPCPDYPQGYVVVWCQKTILGESERFPFVVNGKPHMGIVFYKYRPVSGRFWALGLAEPLIGPQRQRNRARSQWIEMKDRAGLGRVFATAGTVEEARKPKGGIFELIELRRGAQPGRDILETQGTSPGPWLQAEVQQNDLDMDMISGLNDVSMGRPTPSLAAYASLALVAEQDDRRQSRAIKHIRNRTAFLAKLILAGMREYWPPEKQIDIAGENNAMDSYIFNAAQLPEVAYVKMGTGAPLPKSPAAEVQMAIDIFDRSISSGQPLPLRWLLDSLRSAQAQDLPDDQLQVQFDKAELENQLMMRGMQIPVAPYDNDELHVARHQALLVQISLMPEYGQAAMMLQMHIQAHFQSAQAKAQQMERAQAQQPGGGPQAPPEGNGRDAGFGQVNRAQQQMPMAA